MTTGRINQVTIVRRGWPTGASDGAGEISKLLVGARGRAAAQRGRRGRERRVRQSAFPLFVHQSAVRHTLTRGSVRHGRPSRRTGSAASAMTASASARLPPVAQWYDSPTASRPQNPTRAGVGASPRRHRASPVRRAAVATDFVGGDAYYEPPASEAGACKPVQRATQ